MQWAVANTETQMVNMPRTSDGGCSALDGSPLPTSHSSGRRKHPQRAGAVTMSWRMEMEAATLLAAGQDGTVAPMIHSSCGCRHTTCTRLREATFQHGWERAPRAPTLAEELLAVGGF